MRIEGRSIYMIHDVADLKIDPAACGYDVVVYGHSHQPKIEKVGGILYLNPGSAGRRRFRYPATLATLDISNRRLEPVIHELCCDELQPDRTSSMRELDLERFVEAQTNIYDRVVAELTFGRKSSHWMWFIFPQVAGLGFSAMAQRYAIRSRAEAEAYLAHKLLGPRLERCTQLALEVSDKSITEILGSPDDMKFRSSMTLFHNVSGRKPYADAIAKLYPDGFDQRTLSILAAMDR